MREKLIDVTVVGGPMDGTVVHCLEDQIIYNCIDSSNQRHHVYPILEIECASAVFNLAIHPETFPAIDDALQHILKVYRNQALLRKCL